MDKRIVNLQMDMIFLSPFIVASGFGLAGIIDSTTVKDNDKIVYIPASSIKGKIRSEFKKVMESLEMPVCNSIVADRLEICKNDDVKDACAICRIFGSEFYDGCLIFEDAVMEDKTRELFSRIVKNRPLPAFQSSIRSGIKLNRYLKTAKEGALFTFEGVNPSVTFRASFFGSCYITDEEYSLFKGTIETITHLGGNKAGGMGRCNIRLIEVTP